jgi:hypothetical protein
VPGKIVREVTDEEYEVWILEAAEEYARKAVLHAEGKFL